MLYDRARIHVQAGAGGGGAASFRREAHVPRGGPDGGDGGRGGDVVLVCSDSLRDLQGFRRKPHHKAERGGNGEGSLRHGADGQPLVIRLPPGTQVVGEEEDLEGRRWELLRDGQRIVVANGGSGGRGNKRFATPTRQAPRFAERGLPGEEGWLQLRLKLLADVGLVGLPNAGKSSLLARLTRAAPKVAAYPFTTLEPNLGVIDNGERQLVVADIPGLIEGASEGAGLGHEFLAHVERTRLLVHVLDVAPLDLDPIHPEADPLANYETIERELAAHDPRLASLPRVLVLSKADLVPPARAAEAVAQWSARLAGGALGGGVPGGGAPSEDLLRTRVPVIATSAVTGLGLSELAGELFRLVPAAPAGASGAGADDANGAMARTPGEHGDAGEELAEHMLFRPVAKDGFSIEQTGPGAYAVRGRRIERLLQRFDVDNEDAMAYVEARLRRLGVIQALEAKGFQPGDDIEIGGTVLELDPSG